MGNGFGKKGTASATAVLPSAEGPAHGLRPSTGLCRDRSLLGARSVVFVREIVGVGRHNCGHEQDPNECEKNKEIVDHVVCLEPPKMTESLSDHRLDPARLESNLSSACATSEGGDPPRFVTLERNHRAARRETSVRDFWGSPRYAANSLKRIRLARA